MSLSPDCATLLEQVPADASTIGNLKLREQLGWDEERYLAARQPLLDLGVLETGRGRGGSVKRTTANEETPPTAPGIGMVPFYGMIAINILGWTALLLAFSSNDSGRKADALAKQIGLEKGLKWLASKKPLALKNPEDK